MLGSKWQRLVNTDFSKPIRLTPQLNAKDDIIWSAIRRDADEHGGIYVREKFSPGVMLWGGISWKGLIPKDAPVFVDEFLDGYQWSNGTKKTVNGARYEDLISNVAYPSVMKQHPKHQAIFQTDAAKIHRPAVVLQMVDSLFSERIPVDVQSPRFDDVWAIETVWWIIDEKLFDVKYSNLIELKKEIKSIWRLFSSQKCQSIISSMVRRTSLLTENGGKRVSHDHYRSS